MIWIPAKFGSLLIVPPTVLLWWIDRRRTRTPAPAGHCQNCGYNLRGLAEPRCPECGTPFKREGDAA